MSDQDIYAVIEATRPAATICWTRLTNVPPNAGTRLSIDFVLGASRLSASATTDDTFVLDESTLQ